MATLLQPPARDPRAELGRRARQPRARARSPTACSSAFPARSAQRSQVGVDRQSGARSDIAAIAAARASASPAARAAAAARARRQPGRAGAERGRAAGARAAAARRSGREVTHQAGAAHIDDGARELRSAPACAPKSSPFIDDMAARYAEADLHDLPRRRVDGRRARRGRRAARARAVPACRRRPPDAQRALPGRARRGGRSIPQRELTPREALRAALLRATLDAREAARAMARRSARVRRRASRDADAACATAREALRAMDARCVGPRMRAQGQTRALRGHRRRRHERHRRGAAEPRLPGERLRSRRERGHAAPAKPRRARSTTATPREHIAGAERGGDLERGRGRTTRKCRPRARKTIPVVPRALMLAELMRFKQGIAVAGTHGKTTTTSLTASVLAEGGLDPTFVIGGRARSRRLQRAARQGRVHRRRGRRVRRVVPLPAAVLAVVTNIDADHMETYDHSVDKLRQAFVDFLQHLPFYGVAVLCIDDPGVREIMPRVPKTIVTYGLSRRRAGARGRHRGARRADALSRQCARERRRRRSDFDGHAQPAGRAQRAERARRDRGRAGGRRRATREDRRGARRVSKASAGASSATARSRSPAAAASRWSTTTAITRRRWRRRSQPRAALSRAAASCSRSSRTATRARATASRIS